ncbi:ABC transporter permease [Clostridium aestuarii]|uniref:ABC transporter permease n=1 Tax=Clostridium aestuarii TaxID=338193 RepID=A0ABT4CWR1_9CLOT|nr:ABC transporter permease [Clostridium aestuarii]MCY6483434.1 ABC transporter permease [Clostridium aestuarii]
MTIFTNNLKRIFKSKSNIIFMVIFPIVLIIFFIGANSGESKFSIGVVDNDNTKLTKLLVKQLEKGNEVNDLKESQIKKSLINLKNDYVIQIPKGFTKDLIEGKDVNIKAYAINETNAYMAPKFSIESFVGAAKTIGKSCGKNETLFYKAMDKYKEGVFEVKYENMDNSKVSKKNTLLALGFLVFNMMMLGVNIIPIILKDKKTKVYYRIFTGPIKARSYTLQNLLSFLVVLIIQIAIIFGFMIKVFNMKFPSVINMFLLFVIFSIFVAAFALFICDNSKDMRRASIISTLTVTPMAMLGGCFWPRGIMPQTLQNISKFIPVTWMLSAANKLMYNESLYSVLQEILVLFLFTIIFMLLVSWRKKDIIN